MNPKLYLEPAPQRVPDAFHQCCLKAKEQHKNKSLLAKDIFRRTLHLQDFTSHSTLCLFILQLVTTIWRENLPFHLSIQLHLRVS